MFNYHTYEKLQKKKKDEEDERRREERVKAHKKEKNKQLLENYENRINQFIISMAHKPIKIKDYTNPVENPRMQLMKESDEKITGGKGFVFKGFITEKERIKNYLEEREKYLNDNDVGSYTARMNKNKKKDGKHNTYIQPQMRFKPRTELERIFDAINEYSYGRVSKDLVNKQLRLLDLNHMKKVKSNNHSDSEGNSQEELEASGEQIEEENEKQDKLANFEAIIKQELLQKGSFGRKKIFKPNKVKIIDNSQAKNLMKEYHFKTHFKAASVVAAKHKSNRDNSPIEIKDQQHSRQNSVSTQRNLFKRNNTGSKVISADLNAPIIEDQPKLFSRTGINFTNKNSPEGFNLYQKFSSKFSLDEENLDIIECNPLLYNINMNPLRKNQPSEYSDKDKLADLKRLAYESKEDPEEPLVRTGLKYIQNIRAAKRKINTNIVENPKTFFKNLNNFEDLNTFQRRDDDKIWVDNELVSKKQVDYIAKKILKSCNYVHSKKDANDVIKKGTGKLMITSGLTVDEFSKKYNVPK